MDPKKADAIMSSVQKLVELMATSFAEETTKSSSSSSSSSSSNFTGLPPDELQRVSILARSEVVQLRSLFKESSQALESSPGLLLTTTELDEMEAEIQKREFRVETLLKILPEDPNCITALSGEAEKYANDILSINWPLETSTLSTTTTTTTISSSNAKL